MSDPTPQSVSPERLLYLDLFRGIAILAVVGIHLCATVLGLLGKGTPLWRFFATISTSLLFAVPAFLLLSALLLTRSGLKRFNLSRLISTRTQQVLVPYLLWSLIYTYFSAKNLPDFTWREAFVRIAIGKSFQHLYFLGILLQFYLLFPFLLRLMRRRPPFLQVSLVGFSFTLAFYWLNRLYLHLPYVGSVVFWYTPVLALGLWLGTDTERIGERVQRGLPVAVLGVVLGFASYPMLNLQVLQKQEVDTFLFQVSEWVYTTSASFCLLWFVWWWQNSESRLLPVLSYLGTRSMQIYLLHPMILSLLGKIHLWAHVHLWVGVPLCFILVVAIPLGIAYLADRLRCSVWIFGR